MKIIRNSKGQFKSQSNPILNGAFVLLLGSIIFAGLWYGMAENDKINCYKLQKQSVEYKDAGFFITELENKICEELSIKVNAPVHGAQIEQIK